jgi:SAM-dependent methyltransferase
MEQKSESYSKQDKFSAFWEHMALSYPLPFEDKTFADTCRVISLVKSKGVEIGEASILDIGCGTGIFTLPLAREAAMVTGLDDSDTMISRMKNAMASEDIRNVTPITASWKDIDISARRFEKAFDIVWVSMNPAIQTAQDFERMEKCARKWCVYIGWGRKRKNALMEEIFSLHGTRYGPPPGAAAAYDILTQSGKRPSLDYFEASWEWSGRAEDALEDAVCFIEMQGGKARRDLIQETLNRHERDGLICHITDVEEGLLVWPAG